MVTCTDNTTCRQNAPVTRRQLRQSCRPVRSRLSVTRLTSFTGSCWQAGRRLRGCVKGSVNYSKANMPETVQLPELPPPCQSAKQLRGNLCSSSSSSHTQTYSCECMKVHCNTLQATMSALECTLWCMTLVTIMLQATGNPLYQQCSTTGSTSDLACCVIFQASTGLFGYGPTGPHISLYYAAGVHQQGTTGVQVRGDCKLMLAEDRPMQHTGSTAC